MLLKSFKKSCKFDVKINLGILNFLVVAKESSAESTLFQALPTHFVTNAIWGCIGAL